MKNSAASKISPQKASATNACKLCKPLGACIAFKGIEGAVPFLHGSQGCATYMRRYLISHFREPVDIASSSLGEKNAIYGGGPNLKQGVLNVMNKYGPSLVGVATTCLTETIGDDVPFILNEFRSELGKENQGRKIPELVDVSTPSYKGAYMEGFHDAIKSVVDGLAMKNPARPTRTSVNVLPGFVSSADTRHLKEILADFGLESTILPDISLTLDGPALAQYEELPRGGTPLSQIRAMGSAAATLEFGRTIMENATAGALLAERFGVKNHRLGMPIGLRETDRFFKTLKDISGHSTPDGHLLERGRLVDAYVDAHKYLFGKKAIIYGEEDLVVGLTSFLAETGIKPVYCASGGKSGRLAKAIEEIAGDILQELPMVRDGVDFSEIADETESLGADILIGNSKGYHLAKRWKLPLMRVGFPIHDRFGGQRVLHLGYRGAQSLFDKLVNTFIRIKQESSQVGYGYL